MNNLVRERDAVLATLSESEERYRTILDSIEEGYFEVDLAGNFTFFNASMRRMLGYSADVIMGLNYRQYLDVKTANRVYRVFNRVYRTGEPTRALDWLLLRNDDTQQDIEVSVSLIRDAQGEPAGFRGIARDVTERVRTEAENELHREALKQARDELEIRVEERTSELSSLLSEKEVLLQEIHHRVKNNLQIISSLLSLQSDRVDDQQALAVFEDSRHRVKSMALIHEKLYRSRNLARIDFADYIRDLTRYLFASYVRFDQDVDLNVQVDDVHLGIDSAVPCGLILNELVSNALKHAFPAHGKGRDGRETPPTGEIRVELRGDTDDTLTMLVADNGVGLPRDLDVQYTTSLGLQLVTTLVEQLDGRLGLDDRGGTRFEITFPAPRDLR